MRDELMTGVGTSDIGNNNNGNGGIGSINHYGDVAIELDRDKYALLRDIGKYPFGTLSSEYLLRKCDLEQHAKNVLLIPRLGDGRIPAPVKILEYWFKMFFSDPTNFFCCSSPSHTLFKLCDFLTQSPFYCLYAACITMNSNTHVFPQPQPTQSPEQTLSQKRRRQRHIPFSGCSRMVGNLMRPRRLSPGIKGAANKVAEQDQEGEISYTDRTQSIIGICSNPPSWITHKNRRMIALFIQMILDRRAGKVMETGAYDSFEEGRENQYDYENEYESGDEDEDTTMADFTDTSQRESGEALPPTIITNERKRAFPGHDDVSGDNEYKDKDSDMTRKKRRCKSPILVDIGCDITGESEGLISVSNPPKIPSGDGSNNGSSSQEEVREKEADLHVNQEVDGQTKEKMRKKMRSSWSLVAYIILDRYSHPPELIQKLSREALYSKGIINRIYTLCNIAQQHKVPMWISNKAMECMDIGSVDELIFAMETGKPAAGNYWGRTIKRKNNNKTKKE